MKRVKYKRLSYSVCHICLLSKYHLIMLRASKSYDEDGDIYEAEEKIEKKNITINLERYSNREKYDKKS